MPIVVYVLARIAYTVTALVVRDVVLTALIGLRTALALRISIGY
jgi:hypothetical protein